MRIEKNHMWENLYIDKTSTIPAYYQIKEYIKRLIVEGQVAVNVQLPAERELCILYDVSRMTARQALSELVKEGFLYREKGRGTFVAPPKITHPMMSLVSFSEDMHIRGMTAGGKTLKKEIIRCRRRDIQEALKLSEGEEILSIERLRLADAIPMVLERSYFSFKRYGILEKEDLETNSLYEILQRKMGVYPKKSQEVIESGLAGSYLSDLLGIDKHAPILVVTGVSFEENGQPIEYVESYYRGDRYRFLVEMERA